MSLRRHDVAGTTALSWDSRHDLYGNYICHTFQGGSWADRSPLHETAFHGQLLALMALLAQGFSVNIVTMERVSPLHDACLGGRVSCARFLLEKGAAVNLTTIDGVTPLFSACRGGNPACVQLLLDHGSALHPTHCPALLVASPIHEAAQRGHWECMEILISHGVDLDLDIPKLGTPLYISCVSQKLRCVERLLQLGADVCRGRGQDTPLHAAARRTDVRVVELLMDYGADVWSRDGEGRRPVELAPPLSLVKAELLLRERPPALSQLCRLLIRRALGSMRLHLASRLSLPSHQYNFLFYRQVPVFLAFGTLALCLSSLYCIITQGSSQTVGQFKKQHLHSDLCRADC